MNTERILFQCVCWSDLYGEKREHSRLSVLEYYSSTDLCARYARGRKAVA